MKGAVGATPCAPKAKVQQIEPTCGGPVLFVCRISPLTPPTPTETPKRLDCCRSDIGIDWLPWMGVMDVGRGGSNLPSRPPASFKDTMDIEHRPFMKRNWIKKILHFHLIFWCFFLKLIWSRHTHTHTKHHKASQSFITPHLCLTAKLFNLN